MSRSTPPDDRLDPDEGETAFIAHLRIEKRTKISPPKPPGASYQQSAPPVTRKIKEVTSINLTSSDLQKLLRKLNGHLELIEED